MKHLKQTASDIIQSHTPKEKYELLSHAFEMFSVETSRLENAYASLKDQFKALNLELQETNTKLSTKLEELDLVTEYLKSVLNNINQGILFIDLKGSILTYNHAAEAIIGMDRAKILLNNFSTSFADDAFGFSMREAIASLQIPGTVWTEYDSQQGQHYELEVSTSLVSGHLATPLLPANVTAPNVIGLLVMLRDVTDMRRLQLIAHRSDRMKELGNMAAQVAHEIRNPLGGIKGFASLLERDLGNTPKLQQMAHYIVEGTDNLNRLVNQVLDYARPCLPHFEKIDLIFLLKEIQQHVLADDGIDKKNIEIQLETSLEHAWVFIDHQLFKSGILNLVVNAIQAMSGGGKLTISVKHKRREMVLTLSDTGTGIQKDNLSKIFSPFFTTKPKGNGFGLAEVHKIIQAHEGTIDVTSAFGNGTTFVIKLPLKTQNNDRSAL